MIKNKFLYRKFHYNKLNEIKAYARYTHLLEENCHLFGRFDVLDSSSVRRIAGS